MELLPAIVVALLCLGLFVYLMVPTGKGQDEPLDPTDPRTLGMLVGMTGGSVADAAVARFALERFEQEHGRKATLCDAVVVVVVVVGIMRGMG
ncbi:MAG: hypothetical protein ACRCT8_05150 [Lacipirellulaceae bacterium]